MFPAQKVVEEGMIVYLISFALHPEKPDVRVRFWPVAAEFGGIWRDCLRLSNSSPVLDAWFLAACVTGAVSPYQ